MQSRRLARATSPISLDASPLHRSRVIQGGEARYSQGGVAFVGVITADDSARRYSSSKAYFIECTFKDNYAKDLGGVAYVESGKAKFKGCKFDGNSAGCGGYEIFQAECNLSGCGSKVSAENAVVGTVNECEAFGVGYGLGIPVLFFYVLSLLVRQRAEREGPRGESEAEPDGAGFKPGFFCCGFIMVLTGFSLFVASWGGARAAGLEIAGGVVCGAGALLVLIAYSYYMYKQGCCYRALSKSPQEPEQEPEVELAVAEPEPA